ncbi:TRAP transporter small permease subunit [Pannonibacter tanglangensis]|uniref:TRAP transporter small permease protein n=1 Tax=Pannonibacter tanglangensis TaxID=2750084 RepID=A0ABW9ZKA2_9HYPH|nr:TRAP transporter small permease subunit [Pannonibacter sp. XCT-34]NBN65335.1 TRAP transporter small permease subunit [Pannonibacter sp. XCT-34]
MMAMTPGQGAAPIGARALEAQSGGVLAIRLFGWINLAVMAAYLLNNYLTNWQGLPGAGTGSPLAMAQTALYGVLVLLAVALVLSSRGLALRADSDRVTAINTYLIRWAFWAVVLVGLVDSAISFLRVEGMLETVVGTQLASDLGRSQFRGAYVHMPLIGLSLLLAAVTRTLGFHWLGLLVVISQFLIVLGRFVFSYEQAFLSDLVRFWYAALFLFAAAYTLLEEGHVRVDVLYAGFSTTWKGFANAFGCIFFGLIFCWTILIVGLGNRQSIINSPMLAYETTQAGFGLYVKYLMAGFLGVFAVTMMIQFVAYLFAAVADMRGDPGGRDLSGTAQH